MAALRLAIAAATVVITVAQHPVVRAGIRTVVANPRVREIAADTAKAAAYNAGVIARKIVPRALVP